MESCAHYLGHLAEIGMLRILSCKCKRRSEVTFYKTLCSSISPKLFALIHDLLYSHRNWRTCFLFYLYKVPFPISSFYQTVHTLSVSVYCYYLSVTSVNYTNTFVQTNTDQRFMRCCVQASLLCSCVNSWSSLLL